MLLKHAPREQNTTFSSSSWALLAIATAVLFSGLLTMSGVLAAQVHFRHIRVVNTDAQLTLLAGLTLIYLANLLRRGKYIAWLIAVPVYMYIVARNIRHFVIDLPVGTFRPLVVILNVVIPLSVLGGLLVYRRLFTVRSELRSFSVALRWAAVILFVAFLYGVIGFRLMDERDFHKEISFTTAAHYTVDQFGLTTDKQLEPQTKRAQIFVDSLAIVSLGSVFYVVVSLFSPIRFRLSSQEHESEAMQLLLEGHPASSEDFFKLWPHDKAYFFNGIQTAGLAYHVSKGVAMVVGDPAGKRADFKGLILEFGEYCRVNDWQPAFIHVEPTNDKVYRSCGYDLQKIGEEAVLDINKFTKEVLPNKYFRHITNKFEKAGYTAELLQPPHSAAVLRRLREVSADWLTIPGRSERGFMMGYFSDAYMQRGPVVVARDDAGTIQAFINQIPSFNKQEANYDFLRHTKNSLGNINDFLLINFIKYLQEQGLPRLNLGLCPLTGLDESNASEGGAVDSVLRFVYANGNRFYSFKGLQRFKAKYEPEWQDRFVAYKGGLRGFTRTLNGLRRAMRVPRVRLHS